jgi:hypothetical protein
MTEQESSWKVCFHLLSSIIFALGLIYGPENSVAYYSVGFAAGGMAIFGLEELSVKIKSWIHRP